MLVKKLLSAFLLAGLFVNTVFAVPAGFNIQGRLTDSVGTVKNGTFNLTFSIYQANSAFAGEVPVWTKTISGVPVQNGNFQTTLEGTDDSTTKVDIETAVKDLPNAYVEVKVGTESPMAPRLRLLRSPFSPAQAGGGSVTVVSNIQDVPTENDGVDFCTNSEVTIATIQTTQTTLKGNRPMVITAYADVEIYGNGTYPYALMYIKQDGNIISPQNNWIGAGSEAGGLYSGPSNILYAGTSPADGIPHTYELVLNTPSWVQCGNYWMGSRWVYGWAYYYARGMILTEY